MGKTATNLSIVLGLITVAFAGYYMYTMQVSPSLNFESNEQTTQNMLNNTRVFIERSEALNKVTMDVSFFEDERFNSLKSYSSPVQARPEGREDPFAEVYSTSRGSNF